MRSVAICARTERFGSSRTSILPGSWKIWIRAFSPAVGGIARLPYDGIVSGPFDATGKLQESDFHSIVAGAHAGSFAGPNSLPVHGEVDREV